MSGKPDFGNRVNFLGVPDRPETLIHPRLYLRLRFPGHRDGDGEPVEFSTFETWAVMPVIGSRIVVNQWWHFRVGDREWHLGGSHRPTLQLVALIDARSSEAAVSGTEYERLKFTPEEFAPVWRDYCAAIGNPLLGPATERKTI